MSSLNVTVKKKLVFYHVLKNLSFKEINFLFNVRKNNFKL